MAFVRGSTYTLMVENVHDVPWSGQAHPPRESVTRSIRLVVRVVQWATGAVGRAALQELIENPDYQLVGVLVYDPQKAGLDAGALCGLPPTTGVTATTDKDALIALRPDVVIHAASKAHAVETNAEDICRLLAAGTNVITTTSYNHLPTYGARTEAAFVEACQAGQSRFHAAGENPGFMFERLVATVTGLSKSIDRIDLYEATDVSAVDSRPMLVDLMGMGRPPADVSARLSDHQEAGHGLPPNAQCHSRRTGCHADRTSRCRSTPPPCPTTSTSWLAKSTPEPLSGKVLLGRILVRSPVAGDTRGMGAHPRSPAVGSVARWPPDKRRR